MFSPGDCADKKICRGKPGLGVQPGLNSTSNTIVQHSRSLFILGLTRLPALGLSNGAMFEADVLVYL
jgi:hypothetical protein